MQSRQQLLEKMARNPDGILTLRIDAIGKRGEMDRQRAKIVDNLVNDNLARWIGRCMAKITPEGRETLEE